MSKSDNMTNEELLRAIEQLRWEIAMDEYEISQERDYYTTADEYMLSSQEEYLDRLEKAYIARGLKLPERYPSEE